MHVGRVQRVERSPTGVAAIGDHDRLQRLAERRLDRGFPAVVDLDQVEQRAEHAVDAGEVLGTGAGAGALERQVQRLGARPPARRVVGGRPGVRRSRLVRGLGGDAVEPRPPRPRRPARPRSSAPARSRARSRSALGVEPLDSFAAAASTRVRRRRSSASARSSAAAQRAQLAADLGRGAGRRACRSTDVVDGGERLAALARRTPPPRRPARSASGPSRSRSVGDALQLVAQVRRRPRGWRPRRRPSAGRGRARATGGARRARPRGRGPARGAARRAPARRRGRCRRGR